MPFITPDCILVEDMVCPFLLNRTLYLISYFGIIEDYYSSIPISAKVFTRIETETSCISKTSSFFPVQVGTKRLGTIFNYFKTMPLCYFRYPFHIRHLTKNVNR